ncbi:MAG: glycosyltransferase [Deltaproteobacteria bacterium]|nr:glycosyltransferase [Deltaproteobacteria bacterium]
MNKQHPVLSGTIVWIAPFYNRSGFGVAARTSVAALHKAGARIKIISVNQAESGIDDCDLALIKSLEATPVIPPVTAIISHVPSRSWLDIKLPEPNVRIMATTVFDCHAKEDSPPAEMLAVCREMDQIWLHVEFEREAFIAAGFPPEMVHTVYWPHHWLENPALPPPFPETSSTDRPFRFLNISLFLPRRRWDTLIEAYLEEFKRTENVELYLKVNYPLWHPVPGKPRQDLLDLVASLRRKTGSEASIILDEDFGTRSGIARLIDSCNAYVSTDTASTAPVGEARVRQRMVILPEGVLDMSPECYVAIPIDPHARIPLTQEMLLYQPNHKGSSMPLLHVQDVRNAMRRAYDMPNHERQTRAAGAANLLGTSEVVSRMVSAINAGWQYKMALEKDRKAKNPVKRIAWEGSQFVRHSLALVNRELCIRLIDSGCEVSIIPYGKDDIHPDADPRFMRIVQRTQKALSGKADVHIRHRWPPNFQPPREGYWVNIQPWEFGSLPEEWIRPMTTMIDEMWVPSSYVRECYIRSGVQADRVFVVPNGVDTATFHPDAVPFELSTTKRFKFLFVGGTIFRKGIDALLDAYFNTFSEKDDVCLVIKDMGGKTFYKGQTAQQMIEGYRSRPGAPGIEYIEHALNDKDMAGLYTACSCLVHPYRGEGFGLPIAEAMACGLPVVVTGYGAALDFCTSENAYLIPACEVKRTEKKIGNIKTVDYPWLAEPDQAALQTIMKHVFENRGDAQEKAMAALSRIKTKFTWEEAAKVVMQRIDALHQKPIRRFESATQPVQNWVDGLTTIVMRVSDDLELVKKCFKSIRKHTGEPHEIIVVAHNSSPAVLKWVKKILRENNNCKCIENAEDLGFAEESNQGIREASGEYLLLLDLDVVVSGGWLAGMIGCLESVRDVGVVGPMTVIGFGLPRVSRSGSDALARPQKFAQSLRRLYQHRRISARHVAGFCAMFKRDLVDDVGLFDEGMKSSGMAVEDFCLRAELAGYRNLIAGDVFVKKHGTRKSDKKKNKNRVEIIEDKRRYDEKWEKIEQNSVFSDSLFTMSAVEKADEFYQKGQIDEAIGKLLEGITRSANDARIYHRFAEILIDSKRYKDGLDAICSAPENSKKDSRRLELIGYCKEGLESYGEAEDCADKALNIEPASASALNLKGLVAFRKGDSAVADVFFKKAIEADAGYGDPYTNRGILKWAEEQTAEALDLFEKGFVLTPTRVHTLTTYHSAITAAGQFQRAEELFTEARECCPNSRRIAFLLIDLLLRQNKHAQAMDQIEQAMASFGIDEGILSAALAVREKVGAHDLGHVSPNRLSLCMIVKNEQGHLARCLSSAKPVVDEIIIVDTGSNDRTKEIATAFGARVFDFQWGSDFSTARNFSLSKATGDWILVLDADEVISPADYPILRAIVHNQNPKKVAYALTTRNYTNQIGSRGWTPNDGEYPEEESARGWFPSAKVRLFLNHRSIQFENAVHETVESAIEKCGIRVTPCQIPIHHYGRLNHAEVISKGKEYFLLGRKKMEETGGDINALRELAIQAAEIGEYDEAINIWKELLEREPADAVAWMNMGYAYLAQKNFSEALSVSKKALELNAGLKEAALNYSNCELITGNAKNAVCVLEKLLKSEPDYPPAMGLIASAYYVDGQKEKGLEFFRMLWKKRFNCEDFVKELAAALISEGRAEQAGLLFEAAGKMRAERSDDQARTHHHRTRGDFLQHGAV